ncbi:MAG: hypothetical protein ABSB40_02195 [Nitrososphaeria archaeon]
MGDRRPQIIIGLYILLLAVIGLLRVNSNLYGLSTVLSTNFLGTMVFNTTTLDGSQLTAIFGNTFFQGSLVITILALATVIYVELADPSYGTSRKIIEEFRKSWMTPASMLVILFSFRVLFEILNLMV